MATSGLPSFDPSRLPSYRSSHVGRFHPYPRSPRRAAEDLLMRTVDHRYGLEPILEEPEPVRLRAAIVCEEGPDGDVSSFELDYPVVGDDEFFGQVMEERAHNGLAVAFAGLLATLRRRYLALVGVRKFVSGEQTK